MNASSTRTANAITRQASNLSLIVATSQHPGRQLMLMTGHDCKLPYGAHL